MASTWSAIAAATVFVVGSFVAGRPADAHQPQGIQWVVRKAATTGKYRPGETKNGDARLKLKISHAYGELRERNLLVVFDDAGVDPECRGRPVVNLDEVVQERGTPIQYVEGWKHPGPRWRMYASSHAVLLRAGRSASVKVMVDLLEIGESQQLCAKLHAQIYEVPNELLKVAKTPDQLAARLHGEQPMADSFFDVFFDITVEDRTYRLGPWEEIFGKPFAEEEMGADAGDYGRMKQVLPVIGTDYQRTLPLPGNFDFDEGSRLRQTLENIGEFGSGRAGDVHCEDDFDFTRQLDPRDGIESQAIQYTLSGMWSTKWTADHSLHPGFGFRAEAWTNEGGSWHMLASDWVQSNGTWLLHVQDSAGWSGTNLRMLYRSYNQYYRPQNQAGDTYSWKGPDRSSVSNNHNEGHWFADTDGGTYNGVGELVDAAMYMWSRLYWIGGINPVPPDPLKVYFPNTWFDCDDGTGPPWSCADRNGQIWLIASHGVKADVVVHEFAHQLNNLYWDGKWPANNGGSHSSNSCYPTRLGMTMFEGFADFLPGWVGYPNRNVAEGGFSSGRWKLGIDLEKSTAPPNCTNGWENEAWIARLFWDLHDTRADGDDILWFNHPGAVPVLYLANGVANNGDARDMRFYEAIYRAAASSGHEDFITDIFEQNRH